MKILVTFTLIPADSSSMAPNGRYTVGLRSVYIDRLPIDPFELHAVFADYRRDWLHKY